MLDCCKLEVVFLCRALHRSAVGSILADCHTSSGANVGSRWVISLRLPFTDVSLSAPSPGCGVVAYGDVSLPPSVVAFKGVCAPNCFPSSESTASSLPSQPPLPAGLLPWWSPFFQPQSTMLFSFAKKHFRLIDVCLLLCSSFVNSTGRNRMYK